MGRRSIRNREELSMSDLAVSLAACRALRLKVAFVLLALAGIVVLGGGSSAERDSPRATAVEVHGE
jgi:hypothetical protein